MMKRVRALFNRDTRPKKKRSAIAARATVSRLEHRLLLAVTWINPSGGDWDTPANWSTDALPGPGDDVMINTAGITITHTANVVDTVKSLTNDAGVTLSGGSLIVSGQVQGAGSLTLAGGTLGGATVDAGMTINVANAGGTLSGVTLGGSLDLNSTSPTVTVTGGLTLSGGSVVFGASQYGVVRFTDAAASLAGTGSVSFSDNNYYSYLNTLQEDDAGGTLTIGANVTVSGGTGTIGYDSSIGGPSNVSFINQGTIDADSTGTITLSGNAWSSSGTLDASGGGTLDLVGSGWANDGTLSAAGGTLDLGGTFTTANLGSVASSAGTVNLTGTLNNTGGTLALTASTGSWDLLGGTIEGGTVSTSGGARLIGTDSGGKLGGGVKLSGDPSLTDPIVLDLNTNEPSVTVSGGALTLSNATVAIEGGDYGSLSFTDAAASLAGTGDVTFSDTDYYDYVNTIQEDVAGGTLTIGPDVTVSGGTGTIGYNSNLGGPSSVSFINEGTIDADAAGTITLDGNGWSNTGTVESSSGGDLDLYGTGWTNPGTVNANAGILNLGNGTWSNSGTVTSTSTTTNLGGTFTQANLGMFTRSGGTVNLTGTLNNAGGTLALTAATGSWALLGGTIEGGTISATGGARLIGTDSGGKLGGGVTLSGDPSLTDPIVLDLNTTDPSVTVSGGALTLSNATVAIEGGNYGSLSFTDAAASLAGTGDLTFSDNDYYDYLNTIQEDVAGGTLTIGPDVTVSGGTGTIGYNSSLGGPSSVSFINEGTIDADAAGTITLDGNGWSNTGTVESSGGGNLDLYGTGWTNSGTVNANAGILNLGNGTWSNSGTVTSTSTTTNLGGTFTQGNLGTFTRSGGTVNVTGTLNNTGGTLALTAATGSWALLGGTIEGGTISATGGARLIGTDSGGKLGGGVTLSGDPSLTDPIVLDLNTTDPSVTVSGGALTLSNATVAIEGGNYGSLSFTDAAASLAGTGDVTFSDTDYYDYVNTIQEDVAGGTLTIGPDVTVSGGTGTIGYNSSLGGPSSVSFINEGTIDADAAGTITLDGNGWSNTGTVESSGGGNLDLYGTGWTNSGTVNANAGILNLGNGTWSNNGTVTSTSTTTNLGGTFTQANLGTFTRSGGTVNLTGTLNNTGGTLALTAVTGSWDLLGGTIEGGTISTSGGARLIGTDAGGKLEGGVMLSGDPSLTDPIVLDLNTTDPSVTVSGGALTLSNATVAIEGGNYGSLSFTDAAASLAGKGDVTFSDTDYYDYVNTIQEDVAGGTLTIGPDVTVSGGTGTIGYNSNLGGPSSVSFINEGTIDADAAGTITLDGNGWSNTGTVESSGGGNLDLYGTGWTNPGTVNANAGILNLGNATWSNSGTVTSTSATTNLGGTFTQANLGAFTRSGGTVNVTGTLNNTGGTLALTAVTGSWDLLGGTIEGGTISTSGGARLIGTDSGGKLEGGVMLSGDPSLTDPIVLDLNTTDPSVTVSGGALTLSNATVAIEGGNYGSVSFTDAAASLAGTGAVTFSDNDYYDYVNTIQEDVAGGTLTIGPDVTVSGGTGTIGYNSNLGGPSSVSFINEGKIDADAAGTITLDGNGWSNAGTVEASNGGTVTATTAPTNFSAGTLTGGTWQVTSPGTLRVPFGSSVVTNAANILLDGASAYFYRDAATTLALSGLTSNAAAGSFTIEGGAGFSSTAAFSNAGSVLTGTGSTFAPDGSYTQTGGSTVLAGGVLGTSSPATTVELEGAPAGAGTVKGSLTSGGQVSPGSATGALTVSGSFTQTSTGSLDVDLSGQTADEFSQLVVGGSAALNGAST